MRAPPALLALVACAAVALGGCSTPPPPSPVASIPKITIDFADNNTSIFLTSLNAEVRYGNISVVLANENLTANLTFHESNSFALLAHTNLTFFALNASADEAGHRYYYNATMHIVPRPATDPGAPPAWQIYIRGTANEPIQTVSIPYRQLLAEG